MELISIYNYNFKTWSEKYPDQQTYINKLKLDKSWHDFKKNINNRQILLKINKYLTNCLIKSNLNIKIFPYPNLLFYALNLTPLNMVRSVILGQDPYFNFEIINNKIIPQAMGLSFSVPVGIKIPSSLNNIFDNLLKYRHIKNKPAHGNLESWANQGVLLLNTALTVQAGHPNSHQNIWAPYTDNLIKYISDNLNNINFVLWGAPALKKAVLINKYKHNIIISSHPSGLSCNKPLRSFPCFRDVDHFGLINKYLATHGKNQIDWNIK